MYQPYEPGYYGPPGHQIWKDFYVDRVQAQARRLTWHGTLTDSDGTDHTFGSDDIEANTGRITRSCADSTDIALGTVYAAELHIGLFIDSIGVTRSKIYGGKITIACSVSAGGETEDIPVGVFNITEAMVNGNVCTITAYDDMLKFDVDYLGVSGIGKPFDWVSSFCLRCGVTLGSTPEAIAALPNGSTDLTLIWNDDIQTYRDALSHLAAALGSVAVIDRSGELRLIGLGSAGSVATVSANDRFESDLAQYTYRPKTIYLTDEATGNLITRTSGSGNAYLDIGTNVLLQTEGLIRDLSGEVLSTVPVGTMLSNIIGNAANFHAVPLEASIPCDPCLDLLDCVTVTGGKAPSGGLTTRLTSIEINIGRDTRVKCVGANTAETLTAAERADRNTSGKEDLLMWQSTDINEEDIVLGELVPWDALAEKTWNDLADMIWGDFAGGDIIILTATVIPKKDWARGQLNFTVNYELENDAYVTYTVYVDEEPIWELTEEQPAKKVVKTVTCPVELWSNIETEHTIQVSMKGERL